ncbi:MAG: MerR family transcriptional regulator [Candidatus Marinimicrobia bacterium]|jgi:DNA-binding transcriptional MerR regulator|nr:MerR family transcriptional regulator [Candidatus Neomarinimicrobiota bacterium]MDP6593741.1 MerR family transcriptional regulator [Candidatus Neomarinimicrobiota bacterium]MDP6837070.1 MerR family transcriptional regulator [Candidatus Neomarinimicrobiota bacterium]MDP6966460.1 MerR family transcriptional regulator [Candidatus Neomarinimicrobiota bacterium]|tara:strand:+ start:2718 stop:3071 length:354 start_codon:yes stop_codon:yes gene_type:complete
MAESESEIRKLYFSISEVSEITDLKQYVLRYWETEFPMLRPQKNRAGNRTYRQSDIDTVLTIKDLLYNQKFTIEGARQRLKSAKSSDATTENVEQYKTVIRRIKGELKEILEVLKED